METEKKQPTRQANDYKDLYRSVAQSHLRTETTKKGKHISTNPLANFLNSAWVLWVVNYIKSRFGPRHKFITYEGNSDKGIYQLYSHNGTDLIKIALAADWGTDTEESKNIGIAISHHKPDYSIHLGDTYFVGAPFEIENNFAPGNSYWHYGSVGSFALTGNHEMYSNGNSYYKKLLPWMGIHHPERSVQGASFFCLENDYWRVIGLDTGYRSVGIPILELFLSKANLRKEVCSWLRNDLQIQNDNRGLILLAHHQYASAFDKKYPSAAEQLAEIIGKERKVLWFWGHEHRFAMYGKYANKKGVTAYGRCIGHGGMPTSIVKKFCSKNLKESNAVLFDNRFRKSVGKTDVGHNGYAVLTLEKENLNIDYYDEEKLLVNEKWLYNKTKQMIEGVEISNHCSELNVQQDINKAIL